MIKWLRNGEELTGSEPGVSILEDGTLLTLASVSPRDSGEYVCVAVNDAGTTERKYLLKVNGEFLRLWLRLKRANVGGWLRPLTLAGPHSAVPPAVNDNESPANVSVVLSQSTSLLCEITGSPTPVITWYKDGVPVCNISYL